MRDLNDIVFVDHDYHTYEEYLMSPAARPGSCCDLFVQLDGHCPFIVHFTIPREIKVTYVTLNGIVKPQL